MLRFYAISFAIVILDQLTKKIILAKMALRDVVEVTSFFDIVHLHNYGAAFSFLHNAGGWQRYFLSAISILVSIVLPFYIKKNQHDIFLAMGLTLVLGGAIGNLVDRLFLGYVVDFVSLHIDDVFYWPAFNVADSAISLGVILLIYDALKKKND
ncbi:MAG: signal peptidase II [Nitrosopumilus sp.]|nr:signal peptidase II [Nitrosopumilus sp.]|tara:strand:- start:492 stop:953 length:462 start_codon:yes stop_codon:yes gene_type:complete